MTTNLISGGEYNFLEKDRLGVPRIIDRNIGIGFNGTDSYGLLKNWSPTGSDWVIEFDMYLNDDTVDEQTVIDGTAFRVFVDGWVDSGTSTEKGNPILELEQSAVPLTRNMVLDNNVRNVDQKWLNVSIQYDGTNLSLYQNNALISTEVISFDAITLTRIGSKDDNTGWMDGKIRRLILTDNTTPSNSKYYAAIKQSGDYILNLLGEEIDLNNPLNWGVPPSGVTVDTVNNTVSMDGTQADAATLSVGISSVANERYIVKYNYDDGGQGDIQIKVDSANDAFASAVGEYDYIEDVTTGVTLNFQSGSGASKFNGTISDISIIETDAIILINHNPTNWYQS